MHTDRSCPYLSEQPCRGIRWSVITRHARKVENLISTVRTRERSCVGLNENTLTAIMRPRVTIELATRLTARHIGTADDSSVRFIYLYNYLVYRVWKCAALLRALTSEFTHALLYYYGTSNCSDDELRHIPALSARRFNYMYQCFPKGMP